MEVGEQLMAIDERAITAAVQADGVALLSASLHPALQLTACVPVAIVL